ncbi:MAG: ABC transporter substrate-binding protein, partial [Nitrospinota bacterium]
MRKGIALLMALALASLGLLASVPAAEAGKIRLGFPSRNLMTMPIYLAQERGIFKKHGLDVEIIYIRGGSATTKAIVAEKIDVMWNEPIATMKAMQKGAKLTFVTAATQRASYQLVTKSDIKSLAELKGRAIGISRPGAISYIMPNIVLRRSGLDPDIANYLPIGTSGARRKALIAGKIDAGVMHVESALKAAERPGLHILVSIPKILPKYPFFWVVLRNDFLKRNPGDVTNLVKSVIEVNRYAVKNKAEVVRVAKKHMALEEKYLSLGFDKLLGLKSFSLNGGLTRDAYDFIIEVGTLYKQIKKKLPFNQYVDMSFQEAALKDLGRVP